MTYDTIIEKIFFESDWKLNRSNQFKYINGIKKNRYDNLQNYLENRFEEYDSLKEILYRIKYRIEVRPTCKYCNNKVKFVGKGGVLFGKYCSDSCRGKDVSKYIWQEGQKRYNMEHYGVEHNFQIEKCKQKRLETLVKHYGENPMGNKEIINKTKNTCLERYGVDCGFFTEYSMKQHDLYYRTRAGKISSKTENKTYALLKKKFTNIKRSFKNELYPWRCDFYLPDLDMYIECHYSQYHRFKPFDKTNEEHIKELEYLQEKSKGVTSGKNQYDMMIYTWTDLDVRKRETAKQNNLNFVELYSFEEAEDFISKL